LNRTSWLKKLEELEGTFKEKRKGQSEYSENGALEIASSLIEEYNLR